MGLTSTATISPALHQLGQVGGLAAWGGAEVEDPFTAFRRQNEGDELGSLILYLQPALL